MIEHQQILTDVFQTAREMRRLTSQYWQDLGRWLDVPFYVYYRFVCFLPYRADPEHVETISRPMYTLREDYSPRDCDDKAVLCACWFKGHGVPVRFIGVSTQENKELNHVFLQLENGLDIDATYGEFAKYIGFYPYYPQVTHRENLTELF